MDGILLVNKPKGITSRDVVNKVVKYLGIKKIGHTGTLDPLATGVLVLCVGKATKLVQELTSTTKEYIAEGTLGIGTDTLDITGEVTNKEIVNNIDEKDLINVINSFKGKYIQEVPKYSAIKVNGKRLYQYARENIEVELPKREVNIINIEYINMSIEKEVIKFKIKCLVSKGTYIRSLIRDIGDKLNVPACMSNLERTKQGNFDIKDCFTLEEIKNNNYKLLNN